MPETRRVCRARGVVRHLAQSVGFSAGCSMLPRASCEPKLMTTVSMGATTNTQPRGIRSCHSAVERAFDGCFFPFALYLLHLLALAVFLAETSDSGQEMPGVPPLLNWVLFSLGVLLSVHWIWAFRSVIAAWWDPYARVLRFSSLGLLFFAACIVWGLLRLPFHALR